MKKLAVVALVALVVGAISVWYMAVLPIRHEFEASEEIVDHLRGKLEVSQAEASRLKEENFILSQTVTTLEASRRSLEEKDSAELRYWQTKYGNVVEELRSDAQSQLAAIERAEASLLTTVADFAECETNLERANERISDLADSMADLEDECTLAIEYASAETRDCFELIDGLREEAMEKSRLAVQVGELEYEVASLARALDRQAYLNEARQSEESVSVATEEEDGLAIEAGLRYEVDEYQGESNFLDALFEDSVEEGGLDYYQDGLSESQEEVVLRLWQDIPEEEKGVGPDWYPDSSQVYDQAEIALERYKARYEEMRKQKEEDIFRRALEADDDDDDWEYGSYSDDLPPQEETWDIEQRMEREEEWWDDLEVDSELAYDDDDNNRYVAGIAFDDDDDYLLEDRANEAVEEYFYDDEEDPVGFFDAKELSGMRNNADRELEAWELERQAENAGMPWKMGNLESIGEDSFSFNAEILMDDDEEDYFADDDDMLPFEPYDDDYGDEDLADFLAQRDFYDDDDEEY